MMQGSALYAVGYVEKKKADITYITSPIGKANAQACP